MYQYFDNDMQLGYSAPSSKRNIQMDHGPYPYIIDIDKATKHNDTYRTALWTGTHLQLTVMSIDPNADIGIEMHPNVDQCLCIVSGTGVVQMGDSKDNLRLQQPVFNNSAILVPAGSWHNVINTGRTDLKLFTLYAPPNHPKGTVQQTKPMNHK